MSLNSESVSEIVKALETFKQDFPSEPLGPETEAALARMKFSLLEPGAAFLEALEEYGRKHQLDELGLEIESRLVASLNDEPGMAKRIQKLQEQIRADFEDRTFVRELVLVGTYTEKPSFWSDVKDFFNLW